MSTQHGQSPRRQKEQILIEKALADDAFRQALLDNPGKVYRDEFGVDLPQGMQVKVVEETPSALYLVLPLKPACELSKQELQAVAGGMAIERLRRPQRGNGFTEDELKWFI